MLHRREDAVRVIAAALVCALVAACQPAFDPDATPAITGSIVARDVPISIGAAPTVHVKERTEDQCGIIFLVNGETRVMQRSATGRITPAEVADLTVGSRVIAWAEYVMESCPAQATAVAIQLIDP